MQLVDLVARVLALVPPWVRIYRIQRDIPMPLVTSGVEKGAPGARAGPPGTAKHWPPSSGCCIIDRTRPCLLMLSCQPHELAHGAAVSPLGSSLHLGQATCGSWRWRAWVTWASSAATCAPGRPASRTSTTRCRALPAHPAGGAVSLQAVQRPNGFELSAQMAVCEAHICASMSSWMMPSIQCAVT